MTELNRIQADDRRVTVIENNEQEDSEQAAAGRADDDNLLPGEVKPSEYDYLLTMPMWSLCEEKVEELIEQMKKKKRELDILKETHIYTLWNRDLDEFLKALDKYEAEEERDRKAHEKQKGETNQR
jgi:DNA topoisomerase-2